MIPHTTGGLLLPFLIEENAKFQLEVSENKGITFLPTKFLDPLTLPRDLRSRTAGLDGASQEK